MRLFANLMVLGIAASPVALADVVYTSPAAFTAATTNPTVIGFNGILSSGQTLDGFNPLIVLGNYFSTSNPGTNVKVTAADYFYGPGFFYSPGFPYPGDGPNNVLDVTFATPTQAFGVDYGGLAGGGAGEFTLSNGTTFTNGSLPGLGTTTFVGFVTSTPITSFSFLATGDSWLYLYERRAESVAVRWPAGDLLDGSALVQDVITATPVPEPGSYLFVLMAGLVAILIARRSHTITT